MNASAKRIARLALLTALGVLLLFLTSVIPSGRLGLMVLASFPVCLALLLYGWGWALGVFAVTALLGFVLFPGATAIGYGAFFGFYPVVKSRIERTRGRVLPWALKGALYLIVFTVYWLLARAMFSGAETVLPWYAVLLLGAVVFVIYDWCCTQVIRFYIDKLARYFS